MGGNIDGCYERLDVALEFTEDGDHIIEQEVYQEPQDPQKIEVVYENWGPSIRMERN
jgi:hypothetical protein